TPTNIKTDDPMVKKAGSTNNETRTTKFDDTSDEEEPSNSTSPARKNQKRTSKLDDTSDEERINEKRSTEFKPNSTTPATKE
ncbi:11131_t:CDS:1, partial [Racocetra fulgida]